MIRAEEPTSPVRTPSSWMEAFWATAMRVDLRAYLGSTVLAGLLVGGSPLVVPPLLGVGIVAVLFARLSQGTLARAVPGAVLVLAIGSAPFLGAQLLLLLLDLAGISVPHISSLVGAVAGWSILPVLSAPAHWVFGRGSLRDAFARALNASGERRRRSGALGGALAGLGLGSLLVAGAPVAEPLLPDAALLLDLLRWTADLDTWLAVAVSAVPITVLAPLLSAVLAEQDDWLLAADVAPPRPPAHALVPLWVAIGLMVVAVGAPPAPAWQRYEGSPEDVEPFSGMAWLTLGEDVFVVRTTEPSGLLSPRPTVHVHAHAPRAPITGPHGGRAVGVSAHEVVFADATGALLAVPIDARGERLDDGIVARIWSRWATPAGTTAWVLAVTLLLLTVLFPRLRPGVLHRVMRPGAFELGGLIEIDPNATVTRRGRRVVISGGVFRSDDGQTVLRIDPEVSVLGMSALPTATTRATLLSPTRPDDLSLRSGTAPFPRDALLLGVGEPRNVAVGHEMHRSAIVPWLAAAGLAVAVCVLLAATL